MNFSIPPAVKHLLIINALVFFAQQTPMVGAIVNNLFILFPPATYGFGFLPLEGASFYPWQLISYMFLHADFNHILFNMFGLWMFGSSLEYMWGTKRFVYYYLLTGLGAALIHMLVSSNPVLGASGGVFGILLAFGMIFPNRYIVLLFPPIPVKAKYLIGAYAAFELFNGVMYTASGVAHFAHLGGMVAGYILIRYWNIRTNLE
jgi:membrane associated rhomboid family serine protease